jgi:hypothetical protein
LTLMLSLTLKSSMTVEASIESRPGDVFWTVPTSSTIPVNICIAPIRR